MKYSFLSTSFSDTVFNPLYYFVTNNLGNNQLVKGSDNKVNKLNKLWVDLGMKSELVELASKFVKLMKQWLKWPWPVNREREETLIFLTQIVNINFPLVIALIAIIIAMQFRFNSCVVTTNDLSNCEY